MDEQWLATLRLLMAATRKYGKVSATVLARNDLTNEEGRRLWVVLQNLADRSSDLRREMREGGAHPSLVVAGDMLERILVDQCAKIVDRFLARDDEKRSA